MATVAHAPGLAVVGTDKQPTAAAAEASMNGDTTTAGLEITPDESSAGAGVNGRRALSVSTPEKAMSEELKDIFNKLIDENGHLDMRNVTTLIWVNRKRFDIVETIVELLIENSNERRVFNGIEFYLPQLAHMIIHLDVHLPSSALEQFALVVCQQSLHVALQLNWILVAALEDYHAELPDGSRNKKANTLYFNRCAKLLQNVERIIALGPPSATGLEELYKTGKLSRHEVQTRTIAERRRQAEKVISSPKSGVIQSTAEDHGIKGWLWHKRWHKRDFPHRSKWIRRWFEVEDRVLYCYNAQEQEGSKIKRAAVLYQASVKDLDYKDGKYAHYFEVHSPMGIMRLRAEDEAGKRAWINSLQKQAQAMPAVAHLYAQDGPASYAASGVTTGRDPESAVAATSGGATASTSSNAAAAAPGGGAGGHRRPGSITEVDETVDTSGDESGGDAGVKAVGGGGAVTLAAAEEAAGKLLVGAAKERESVMSMSTVVLQEAKRNKRFRFFSEERQFVSDLTDVCEALRFVEPRSDRGPKLEALLMKVKIPECAYLPLCRSTEPFQRVIKITPNEAKAFNTKERVPSLVTFETEQTWAPGRESAGSPPLDVASYLHFVYGFHAPMHQDQVRYASSALRGGEDSIMEPDLLAVSEASYGGGDETPQATPGRRHSRSGSFRFRSNSKGLHMPPVHLPGHLSTVWREKPAGAEAKRDSKGDTFKGGKSPFRHNLSSFGSALHARASSIRNVKLPGVRQSINKKGTTPGSMMASTGGEKDGESEGGAGVGGGGKAGGAKPKNVVWEDAEREVGEKDQEGDAIELSAVTDGRLVSPSIGSLPAGYTGEEKQEEEEEGEEKGEAGPQANGGAVGAAAAAAEREGTPAGDAVPVDEDGLDKALQEPSVRSREASDSNGLPPELELEEVTLTAALGDDKGRSAGEAESREEGDEETVRTPCRAYGESMTAKARRIRKQSLEGARAGWKLQRLIMKSNDDVRQEVFIMQLIIFYKEVFEREGLDLWLKPYSILSTAKTTGLIEVLNQATSIDGLKKSEGYPGSLVEHFYAVFGPKDSEGFKAAQRRFACSLAGYSVVSYLLRIKDRHNGNVMLDSDGHIVHIDFGFVLGSAPGNKFSMERAAFKFTSEYLEVLGGKDSPVYEEFIEMFCKGLAAARKYATVTITMLEIMMFQSEFPCFEYMGDAALTTFKKRLMLGAKDSDVARRARRMVNKANAHVGTRLYDQFQLCTNGILP
ncbi:unnamed protein product [Ectocarpus sp. 12 AP-2014]